jgi:hypothetical protein
VAPLLWPVKASPSIKSPTANPDVVPGAVEQAAVAAVASPAPPAATVVVVHVPQPVVEMEEGDAGTRTTSDPASGVVSPKKHMSLRQAGKVVQAAVAFGLHASAAADSSSSPALPLSVPQPSSVSVSSVVTVPAAVAVPAAAAASAISVDASAFPVVSPVVSPVAAPTSPAPMVSLSPAQLQARRVEGQAQLDAAKLEWVRSVCLRVYVYVCV